jgi:hypothetical protein
MKESGPCRQRKSMFYTVAVLLLAYVLFLPTASQAI